ncbi:MAG: pilin [Patescibacteria group bacterium]
MKKVILALLAFAPAFAFAQDLGNIDTFVENIGELVALALPIVVAIALLVFFWGLVKFIFAQGNEESKAEAKKIMLWGLIALFVMVSVWGLVEFIGSALGINQDQLTDTPTVPGI